MSKPDSLQHSFDVLLKQLSAATKKVRHKASEKPVHHLRVTARRLRAVLDLVPALSDDKKVNTVRRRLKKLLKWTGTLRDIQVQLDIVATMRQSELQKFCRVLEKREQRESARVRDHVARLDTAHFAEQTQAVREELVQLQKSNHREHLNRQITRTLESRRKDFDKSRRKFRAENQNRLHEMRIALKKLRYAAEAAQPMLGDAVVQQVPRMKSIQQLVGDARDAAILETALSQWGTRKGKQKAVAEQLERLKRQRKTLLARINGLMPSLDNLKLKPPRAPRPASRPKPNTSATIDEKTVVASPATGSINEPVVKSTAG